MAVAVSSGTQVERGGSRPLLVIATAAMQRIGGGCGGARAPRLLAGLVSFTDPRSSDLLGRRWAVFVTGTVIAATALAGIAFAAALAPSKAPILLVVAVLGGGSFAPLLLIPSLEIPGIGRARAGAALGLRMLVGRIGRSLLRTVSGAMAQSSGRRSQCSPLRISSSSSPPSSSALVKR